MFSLVNTFTKISNAVIVAEELADAFGKLKPYVAEIMDLAEDTYADVTGAGKTKLTAVLSAAEAMAAKIGVSWTTGLSTLIANTVSLAKSTWNALQEVATTVKTNTSASLGQQVTGIVDTQVGLATATATGAASEVDPVPALS